MYAHAADAEGLSNRARAMSLTPHSLDFRDWHTRLAALVDARLFGLLDTRLLALANELALHLGHHAQDHDEDHSRQGVMRDCGCQYRLG